MRHSYPYPEQPPHVKQALTPYSGCVHVGDARVDMESESLPALVFCLGLALRAGAERSAALKEHVQ
jgi:hypothetical protein